MPMDDSMTATMAANAIDEKIKMAGLCEKVEELEEDHSHLREKLHRYKMDNKIEKIEEEKEMYPGVIPTMPIGGYNNCNDNALWALMAMGGLWGNNRRNEGCC